MKSRYAGPPEYKMQFCETHQRRYRTVCDACIFDDYAAEEEEKINKQLRKEIAVMNDWQLGEVTQDDIDLLKERGWSVTVEGSRYCLNCGICLEGRKSYLSDGEGNLKEIDHGAFEDRKCCLTCGTKFE